MTKPPLAVFRCDASPSIGSGHVVRCLTLANALSRIGWVCAFAVAPGSSDTVPALETSGHDVREVVSPAEMKEAWPDGADLVVTDHYGLAAAFEEALRPWAKTVMVIDDLADRNHDCDILLDSAAEESAYEGLVPSHCRKLLGVDFALLRPEFREMRLARDCPTGSIARCRVLISLGGTDPDGRVRDVLGWLNSLPLPLDITIVLGASAADPAELKALVPERPHSLSVLHHVSDMAALLKETDLAIGAGGNSAWERCCVGVPSLLVVLAANQTRITEILEQSRAAKVLFRLGVRDGDMSVDDLRDLLEDRDTLQQMQQAGFVLCDGLGANRVVCEIEKARSSPPITLDIRRVEQKDSDILLEWQRHPDTRRWALDPSVPTEEGHRKWFAGKLSDPACIFLMAEKEKKPVGVVRLDLMAERNGYLISIVIAPDCRGSGLGRDALTLVRMLLPDEYLYAEVLPENTASLGLFHGSGYRHVHNCLYVSPPVGFQEDAESSAVKTVR